MDETKQLIAELHKQVPKVKTYRKVAVPGIDDTWAIDLMDMPRPEDNDGFRYVLTVIDVFSRFIWIAKTKNKDAQSVWVAFESIIRQAGATPSKIWGDQDGAWYNQIWTKRLKTLHITLYSTYSDWGVSIVERAIRTLKTWMMPAMEERGSLRWVSLLPLIVDRYNSRKHSAIKMTPTDARDPSTQQALYKQQYTPPDPMQKKPKFKVGDWVRVARKKDIFEKGYEAQWSYQPYKIRKVSVGDPVVYYVQEGDGTQVEGALYENELQKTLVPNAVLIQDVVQKGPSKSLVRFWGFPEKYNQWLPHASIRSLKDD